MESSVDGVEVALVLGAMAAACAALTFQGPGEAKRGTSVLGGLNLVVGEEITDGTVNAGIWLTSRNPPCTTLTRL